MATKKISDLALRSDADATCNFPVDDASQTWRVTLAQIKTFIQTAIAPLTTLGDILFASTSGVPTRLPGNTAATLKVLAQTGTGAVSAAPAWTTPTPASRRVTGSKTSTYSADAATDDVIPCDATSAGFTVNLPAAAGVAGKVFAIKKTDASANVITVDGNSSETIDGATTKTLTIQYESIQIVSDGSNWHIL